MEGGNQNNEFSAGAMDRAIALVRDFSWLVKRHPIIRKSAVEVAVDAIRENGRCGSRWLGEQVRRYVTDVDGVSYENGIIPLVSRCAIYDEPDLQGFVPTRKCAIDIALENAGGFGRILA